MVDDLGADPGLAAVQCVQAMGQRAFVPQNRLAAAYEPARNKVDARGRGAVRYTSSPSTPQAVISGPEEA